MIIFASSQPCLLILEGAALFGIESSTIKISKIYNWSRYGFSLDRQKALRNGTKVFYEDFNKWMCKYYFDKYIINQNIKQDEKITKYLILMVKDFIF